MLGRRYGLTALMVFVVAHPSQASVTTHTEDRATTSQTSTPRLAVFGRRQLVNGQLATLPKLDGALAEVAERYTSVSAERPLASLHAMNPAARFRLSVPLVTPEVLIDAVTTGDPQALKRALQRIGMRDVATDNLVFVSTGRSVYAIDTTTHKVAWVYPYAASQLAISASGILYLHRVEPMGESLVAINLQ